MRIAHVVDSLELGGMERLVTNLSLFQQRQGHEVSVVCLFSAEGLLVSELRKNKIEVLEFNKKNGISFRYMYNLISNFRKRKFRIVHTHNPLANFYGVLAGRLSGVEKIINTRHGIGNFPFNRKRENIFRISSFFINKNVFVCNKAKESFIKFGIVKSKKSYVVYNGIFLDKFSKIDSKLSIQIRKELNIRPDEKVVGTVARLSPVKDLSTFIIAASYLVQKVKDIKFLIVGSGEELAKLKDLRDQMGLSNTLFFLGNRLDIPVLLNIFDVFVLSSQSEGMPLTLIEAMAAGKPIVATDVGGNPEVILNQDTGILVPPRNPQKIAVAVSLLLNDKKKLILMGQKACKRAYELFDLSKTAENYSLIYNNYL